MQKLNKGQNSYKHSLALFIIACFLTPVSTSYAQSTPTELADMTLDDLLNFEVGDEANDDATLKRWDFAYTYRQVNSGGYRSGTKDFTFEEVLFSPREARTMTNFPVVPTFICQNVHAFSASYAFSDKLSVNVGLPYIEQGTDHISSVPGFSDFLLKSKGIGDIGISGSYQKRISPSAAMNFTLGTRLPTGSIEKTGDTPRNGSGTLERLPYTMQIGSGTLDFTASASYSRFIDDIRLGVSASATVRTGKNDNNYRLGDNIGAIVSAQYSKHHWFQPGVKLNIRHIDNIHGRDEGLLVPAPIPFPAGITNPENYGGAKAHLSAIVKICPNEDCQVSFSAELGAPIYQHLHGIQPKDREHLSISASTKF